MNLIPRLVIVAVSFLTPSCTQYAVLHITSTPPNADLWSGQDGQYLGLSNTTDVRYERSRLFGSDPTAVIIFQKSGYQTDYKIVRIDKWGQDWNDAVAHQNTLTAALVPVPSAPP